MCELESEREREKESDTVSIHFIWNEPLKAKRGKTNNNVAAATATKRNKIESKFEM